MTHRLRSCYVFRMSLACSVMTPGADHLVAHAAAFQTRAEFRQGILKVLRRAVPCDFASYNEVAYEPSQTWGTLEPLDYLPRLDVQLFAELAHEHPVLEYIRRTRDGSPRRISDFLTDEQFQQTELYRRFYRPLGVTSQVAFTLPSRPPIVAAIALSRGPADFIDAECALLAQARPRLIAIMRRIEEQESAHAALAALSSGLEHEGLAVVVCDRAGGIVMATPSARAALGVAGDRLPRPLWEVIVSTPEDVVPLPDRVGVVRREGDMLMLTLTGAAGPPSLSAVQGLGLSRRQAQTVRAVALGSTADDIARSLGVSRRTVEKHLQMAYRALGVTSRSEAARLVWSRGAR